MTWRVARSLETLLAEINAAHPNRSKASDGSIGDVSHSSRYSDHNPNESGVVRARDFTHDPGHGFDCEDFAHQIAALLDKHPALGSGAYVIWNWRIISTDRLSEGWRTYTGSNGHTQHAHVSVQTYASGYDSTAPWLTQEDDTMPTPEETRKIVREEIAAALSDIGDERVVNPTEDGPGSRSLSSMLWAQLRAQRTTNELLRQLVKQHESVNGSARKSAKR